MAISSDYPRPINVNGYVCRNCDDVSKAKRFIDPSASPLETSASPKASTDPGAAVSFGGALAGRSVVTATPPSFQLIDRRA